MDQGLIIRIPDPTNGPAPFGRFEHIQVQVSTHFSREKKTPGLTFHEILVD